jgi:(p)ppGpp synthase/HD superfamily hydrolase
MTDAFISQAIRFAEIAHGRQVRKWTGEPYTNHTKEVAKILVDSGTYLPNTVIAAAHLHDVIEDTPVTKLDIELFFGPVVAQLVWEVTDQSRPSDGLRPERKKIDREHVARASREGKNIKLADLISNTSSIVERAEIPFVIMYLSEKEALLHALKDADPKLLEMAWESLRAAKKRLWERKQAA